MSRHLYNRQRSRLILFFFVGLIGYAAKAQSSEKKLDSLELNTINITLYRGLDTFYASNNSALLTLWLSKSNLLPLSKEIISTRYFFYLLSLEQVIEVLGPPDTPLGEYYLESFWDDDVYYGSSLVFENYRGMITDIRFINR